MDFSVILAFFGAIAACALAIVVVLSGPRTITHWAFAGGMAVLALESVLSGLAADAISVADLMAWQNWKMVAISVMPGIWLLFSLCYARGNYQEFLAKWRWALVVAFVGPLGLAIVFRGHLVIPIEPAGSPNIRIPGLASPGLGLYSAFLLSSVLVLMNLERTFRASVGTMRWRIKFMVLGLGVIFAARAYTSSQALLFRTVNLSLQSVNSAALLVGCALILRSLMRAGHFNVAVYPSQALLQNSFTVLVAGIYLVIVGVLAKLVAFLGGDSSFTLKAFLVLIGLVLLTMLLMSDHVRLHTRRFISRYFQRPLYDYLTVWRTFTGGTARRVEQADLCSAIVKLVSDIFQALSVTIWLLDNLHQNLSFTASTSLSESKASLLTLDRDDAAQVISALRLNPAPIDLDACKEIWAAALRRLHPEEFRKGGNRVCVPMLAGGEMIGVLMVGDRVGGIPFSTQDFDLLKAVADQAAASLLNIQLSQRLTQARQFEAFQAMSAFFVHDLKNTASTLSLMLQNLPVHFNDPAFREDALRGVSKTVTHINDLISRLGMLRQELAIQPVESDFNEVVNAALHSLNTNPIPASNATGAPLDQSSAARSSTGGNLITDFRPLPKVQLDPAQIRNVVTNLVLNARDAVGASGQIRVETSQRSGWAVLSVADNGCGMTPEFLQRSLFRPFQTTKNKGIGIGMFQCKMIVDGHQGRIEVDSEPGKGTTFRVLLPVGPQDKKT